MGLVFSAPVGFPSHLFLLTTMFNKSVKSNGVLSILHHDCETTKTANKSMEDLFISVALFILVARKGELNFAHSVTVLQENLKCIELQITL